MSRECLPDRRKCWTQKVKIDRQTVYLTVGEFADGRPGEIFIELSKCGSASRGFVGGLARMASISLQGGIPLAKLIDSLKGMNFPPNGKVSGRPGIDWADSVIDFVARELEDTYAHLLHPKAAGKLSGTIHV